MPAPGASRRAPVAFDTFYRGTAPRLLRYAYGLTTNTEQAQDLVQEAYARAWQRWRRLRRYEDPEAWLRLVVTRLATDWWRRSRIRRDAVAAQRPPAPSDPPGETVLLVVAALRTLPAAQRRALTLYYLLDRSIAQIAAETGTSDGTVKSWLSRGRTALAQHLRADFRPTPTQTSPTPAGGPDAH
ncbi:MAG TPA: SigE family RNA polymerase sigma factor [Micromonosporaceae bacterium]